MFIDRAKIYVKAGDGGDGCRSFYRDKLTRRGKPDGGDGGDGGSVVIKADPNVETLLDFQYKSHFRAQRGGLGSGKNKKGAEGENLVIHTPPGTVVKETKRGSVICDLAKLTDEVIVASGGRGGRGNGRSKLVTKGEKGEERELLLELKLIADVGIAGFPNAGKSALVSRISNAKPKVAVFPFTTRSPVLGVVSFKDAAAFVVADIPGLIEGAYQGRGLGDEFLRHIERTKILVHILDMAGVDGRDPVADYYGLNKELELYSPELIKKPQILAANKMDLPESRENFARFTTRTGKNAFPISCATGEGLDDLLQAVVAALGVRSSNNK